MGVTVNETKPKVGDPVEWARHYWERYDMGPGVGAFTAMTSTMRMFRMMTDAAEAQLKGVGLNMTDYLLLMTLQLSEDGSRLISRLARYLMVHPTTATLATDRLENRRLLARGPHPTDRRAILVSITAEGREVVQQATAALDQINFGFDGASPSDLGELASLTSRLRGVLGDPSVQHDLTVTARSHSKTQPIARSRQD